MAKRLRSDTAATVFVSAEHVGFTIPVQVQRHMLEMLLLEDLISLARTSKVMTSCACTFLSKAASITVGNFRDDEFSDSLKFWLTQRTGRLQTAVLPRG